jgi:S1-C subfamily serine protease
MEDPRTVFYIPEDAQVVVYFEWEGPAGIHRLEGLWKNPEGKVVVISDFQYDARGRRFGAFWTLAISETVPTGLWTIEARIDGELAGAHTFQIVASPKPSILEAKRRPLPPSEIYRLAQAKSVFLTVLDGQGERIRLGSGFFVGDGRVMTGFEVIDGADAVRVQLSDGREVRAEGVLEWHRREDWAVLKVPTMGVEGLPLAAPDSWAVGDRCYSLEVPQEGSRTIVDGDIVGMRNFPGFGPRIHLSFGLSSSASGSPLLNEFGEVIGIVVRHSLIPGAASLDVVRTGYPLNLYGSGAPFRLQSTLAVPINLTVAKDNAHSPTAFSELARLGHFTHPPRAHRHVSRGTLAQQVDRSGPMPQPLEEKFEYSRRQKECHVYVQWEPRDKVKSSTAFHLFDLDNRLVFASPPRKVTLNPGRMFFTLWTLALDKLPPGMYRLDVILGQETAWRTFFRVVE